MTQSRHHTDDSTDNTMDRYEEKVRYDDVIVQREYSRVLDALESFESGDPWGAWECLVVSADDDRESFGRAVNEGHPEIVDEQGESRN